MKIPEFRTGQFAIWKACVRIGMRPPGLPESWDDCTTLQQSLILAFDQVIQSDEDKHDAELHGFKVK